MTKLKAQLLIAYVRVHVGDTVVRRRADDSDLGTRQPASDRGYSTAAVTLAPEEIPQRIPSSCASRRAITNEASLLTVIT